MKKKHEVPQEPVSNGKRITVEVEMDEEDAERVKQAFAEGKLKHLGVTSIRFPDKTAQIDEKKWAQAERKITNNQRDDGTPPL